jgi:hypothetical protein
LKASLHHAALSVNLIARAAFLAGACGADVDLRRESGVLNDN